MALMDMVELMIGPSEAWQVATQKRAKSTQRTPSPAALPPQLLHAPATGGTAQTNDFANSSSLH